jgi:antibiotic biosynthesis monooxygenase (ABM) superfamily enzyme
VRRRLALLTWAALRPLPTALSLAAGPALARLPLPLRTLVVSLTVVAAMSYGLMEFTKVA